MSRLGTAGEDDGELRHAHKVLIGNLLILRSGESPLSGDQDEEKHSLCRPMTRPSIGSSSNICTAGLRDSGTPITGMSTLKSTRIPCMIFLFFRDMSKMEEDPMIPQVQECHIFCSSVQLFIHFHFPPENAGHYKNTVVYEGGGIHHTFI